MQNNPNNGFADREGATIYLSKNQRRKMRRQMESGQPQLQSTQVAAKSLKSNEKLMAAIDTLIRSLPQEPAKPNKGQTSCSKPVAAQPSKTIAQPQPSKNTSQPSKPSAQPLKPSAQPLKPSAQPQSNNKNPTSSNSCAYTQQHKGQTSNSKPVAAQTSKTIALPQPSKSSAQPFNQPIVLPQSNNKNRTSSNSSADTQSTTSTSSEASQETASSSSSKPTSNSEMPPPKPGASLPANSSKGGSKTNENEKKKQDKSSKKKPAVDPDVLVQHVDSLLESWSSHAPDEDFCCRFMDLLKAPDKLMYDKYKLVRKDFEQVICDKLSYFDIHPFGSTVSGLAFRDSDFDIYVHTNLARVHLTRFLHAVCDSMRRNRTFDQTVVISKARIPLVKAIHKATGSKVDFSFGEHYFGVQNTYIVKHLSLFDVRIKPLTLLLKYWFRANDFSGTGKFTNYCMFMMIVYYLQVLPSPILPPLIEFQRSMPPNEVVGWNVAFNFNQSFRNNNHSSVFQLLFGFFNFYAEFDFKKNIICPLFGRVYDRATFSATRYPEQERYYNHIRQLPLDTLRLKLPACVQDPFTMNVNIGNCGEKVFEVFVDHLKTMVKKIKEKNVERIETVGDLKDLFSCRPIVKSKPKNRGKNLLLQMRIVAKPNELEILRRHMGTTIEPQPLIREWMIRAIDYVQTILVEYMALDVSVIEMSDSGPPKSPKLDGQANVHDENVSAANVLRKFKCVATKSVFQNRQLANPKLNPKAFFAKESEVVAELAKKNSKKMLGSMFTITLSINDDSSHIVFTLTEPKDFPQKPGVSEPHKQTVKECKMIFNFFAQNIRGYMTMFFAQLHASTA